MTDFEKAVRYLCFGDADDNETMIYRYNDIANMVHGDEELIKKYSKKYEKLLDFLVSL